VQQDSEILQRNILGIRWYDRIGDTDIAMLLGYRQSWI